MSALPRIQPTKNNHETQWIDGADLLSQAPEIDWLVEGILPSGTVGDVFGAPSDGKTTLILDLAVHVAAGSGTWCGRRIAGGPVLILGGEKSSAEVWRRDYHRAGGPELIGGERGRFIIAPADLGPLWEWNRRQNIWEKPTGSWNSLMAVAADIRPVLTIIDTIGRVAAGQDPLDIPQQQRLAVQMEALQKRIGGTVLSLSHTNQASKKEKLKDRLDYVARSGGNGLPGHLRWLLGVTRLSEIEVAAALGLDPQNADDAYDIETRRLIGVAVSKGSEMPPAAWPRTEPAIFDLRDDGKLEMIGTQSARIIEQMIDDAAGRKKSGKGARGRNGITLEKGDAEAKRFRARKGGNNGAL